MKKSSIALRRGVAALALTWLGAQTGTAAAADGPNCAGGGGTGLVEVNVAALTSDGRLLCAAGHRVRGRSVT